MTLDSKVAIVGIVVAALAAIITAWMAIETRRIGIELFNAGRPPVRYRMRSISLTFAGQSKTVGQFISRGGRILPGSSTVFWHPTIALAPAVHEFPASGRPHFEFEYSNEADTNMHLLADTVEYTLSGATPGSRLEWLNVGD